MNHVIYLFGASCSGKSTLGEALQCSLGSEWTYIDRDDLIEQGLCVDSTANATLEEKVQQIKNRVIIDAQIPWREKRQGEFYFLILPPLQTLLERDAARTLELKRPEQRARYAREYVIETHQTLDKMKKAQFDYCFDSSQLSIQQEVEVIRDFVSYQAKPSLRIKYTCLVIAGLTFSLICALLYREEEWID